MSRGARVLGLIPAAALAAVLTTGCGHGHNGGSAAPAGSGSPAPAASELAHMRQLVDGADSAAAAADSDAASDK